MPYDPNFPPHNADLISAEFRAQFNGIKALIDAVPAGPPGPQGTQGDVSSQQLADGITAALATAAANSSASTNGVATLDTPFSNDPPTLTDIEVLRVKMNELILAQRR